MQTYLDATFKPDDSLRERQTKLYLQIISVGEELYSKGAAVEEMRKELNRLEPVIAQFRRELEELKKGFRQHQEGQ